MRKKGKARIWWGLLFLLLAGLLIFAGYHIFMKKDHAKQAKKEVLVSKKVSSEKSHAPKKVEQVIPQEKKIVLPEKTEEIQPTAPVEKDPCNQIENQVAEFFKYLDKKSYIQKIEQEMDTYARFKEVIRTLSDRPPIPAGESVASRILTGIPEASSRTLLASGPLSALRRLSVAKKFIPGGSTPASSRRRLASITPSAVRARASRRIL